MWNSEGGAAWDEAGAAGLEAYPLGFPLALLPPYFPAP